tara:strand:- start:302 stop:1567 length:1266 start_codon:yes stop_codon:yes gene_type:complete
MIRLEKDTDSFFAKNEWSQCCTYNNDSSRIAVGTKKGDIYIMDTSTGLVKFRLEGNGTPVNDVIFNHDGSKLVSGCTSGHIVIWSSDGGALRIHAHQKSVNSVAFNHDGTRIASASTDGTIKLWNSQTGANVKILKGHSERVNSVAFDATGKRLVSCGYDKCIIVWDNEYNMKILKGHTKAVLCARFNVHGTNIVSCSDDCTVRVWNPLTEKVVYKSNEYESPVEHCEYSHGGEKVAFVMGKKVFIAHIGKDDTFLKNIYSFESKSKVEQVMFASDDKMLVSVGVTGVCLWNIDYKEASLKYPVLKGLREFYKQFPVDGEANQYKFRLQRVSIGKEIEIEAFIRHKYIKKNMEFNNVGDVFRIQTHHGHWKICKMKRSEEMDGTDTFPYYLFVRGSFRNVVREIIKGDIVVDEASRIILKF